MANDRRLSMLTFGMGSRPGQLNAASVGGLSLIGREGGQSVISPLG